MTTRRHDDALFVSRLTFRTPPDFNFWRTAYSHGWLDLPPFSFDEKKRTLDRILRLSDGTLAGCNFSARGPSVRIKISSRSRLLPRHRQEIRQQSRSCLRLTEDFSAFHTAARRFPRFRWIASTGSGRLLRAPTVFEDVVKMLCTTNCTWALTKLMVTHLTTEFGDPFGDGRHAFPSAERIASTTEAVLRKQCKTGYRAPYLLELAGRVASGELDLESLRRSSLLTPELFRQLRQIKGIGPYASGNILKLLGRYDYLGLDSWVRGKYAELHRHGKRVKDRTIERAYTSYGQWRGLLFWLEMTRHWHHEKFSL